MLGQPGVADAGPRGLRSCVCVVIEGLGCYLCGRDPAQRWWPQFALGGMLWTSTQMIPALSRNMLKIPRLLSNF